MSDSVSDSDPDRPGDGGEGPRGKRPDDGSAGSGPPPSPPAGRSPKRSAAAGGKRPPGSSAKSRPARPAADAGASDAGAKPPAKRPAKGSASPVRAAADADPAPTRRRAPAKRGGSAAPRGKRAAEPEVTPATPPADAQVEPAGPEPRGQGTEPPVVACLRCGTPLTLGARYCRACGAPQVRSGEQAAVALSSTRRAAPRAVRIGAPLLVAGVVVAVLLVASYDPGAKARREVTHQLQNAVDANRELSRQLVGLKPGAPAAPVLARAEAASREVTAASSTLGALQTSPEDSARANRATQAVSAVQLYVSTVVTVLRSPRSKQLSTIGRRAQLAEAAFKSVDDIVDAGNAVDGTRELAAYTRSR